MAISAITSTMLSVSSANSLTSQDAAQSETAVDIEQQVKKNLSESVDYQIIIRMMADKQKSSEAPGDAKTDKEHVQADEAELTVSVNDSSSLNITNQADTVSVSAQAVTAFVSAREQEQASLSISRTAEVQQADPLALDLNGDGLQTSGVAQGILFDINGDGSKEQTSFVSGGDAFLAYDRNGNGVIDSGKELFGDNNGYRHGYAELAAYDDNQDGKINDADAIYDKLQLLSVDQQGRQQLQSLKDAAIASISLDYTDSNYAINQYDSITQLGQFAYDNGQSGVTGDILVAYKK